MEEERYYDEYEIDLREYIKVLWAGKWLIVGLMIVAMLIAGVYSKFFIEPQYVAKSTLLILPPKYTTSLEVSTLPVETYRNLLLTDSMKSSIIEELGLKNDQGEPYQPSNLDGMMDVVIEAQNEDGKKEFSSQAPLIILSVKGTNPELISSIANAWANRFMEVSSEIRKGEVQQVSMVIQRQFEDTKNKLAQAKQKLKNFKEEARLDLAKNELNIKEKKLTTYKDKLIDLKTQLGAEEANYLQLKETLSQLEDEGRWLGDLSSGSNDTEGTLITARNNYLKSQEKLLEFQRKHDIDLLKQKISINNNKLNDYQAKILSLQALLEEKQIEIEKLNELIKTEPEKWNLKKAITNDALWQNILDPEKVNILKNMQLSSEIINPIYQKLKDRLAEDKLLVKSIPEQIQEYQKLVSAKTAEIKEMNYTLKEWEQTLSRFNLDLNNYKKIYDQETSTYQKLKADFLNSKIKIDSLKAQISFYEDAQINLEDEIKNLQNQIWQDEITEQQLTQQVEDIQKTYDMLGTKVEEARITEAQKTSDVKFIAKAIPPTKPIDKNTKLNIAIAGVLALMLGVFIVFFREFMKEDERAIESKSL
ncbi:MAG: hypothetical protein PWR10_2268 [Halanaerobiales bacterium]|nr:hypothetical protein [Halanaerobiales bacterium]